MKKLHISFILLTCALNVFSQYKVRLNSNASIGINANIETYFFAEKLAVEHIGDYVFDLQDVNYSHQPIVYFGYKHFQYAQNSTTILRIAEILKQIRDTLHDNGPILTYLLNQKEFPAKGNRFADNIKSNTTVAPSNLNVLLSELTDSLRNFYLKAGVGKYLEENRLFYKGALQEISKDINKKAYPAIEKWYGKRFTRYELYISPAMPITPGEDNYRGFGPVINSPNGKIPSMVVSSSKMLAPKENLSLYRQYGFDNREVTQFITVHEISHSFVNPLLEQYKHQIDADSSLFVNGLKEKLASRGIRNWYVCMIEHLVRLGEIRIAVSMRNEKEAGRLRSLHIGEYNCVLLPLLEEEIVRYETNRAKYPTFESYLPELVKFLHNITPKTIDGQLAKFQDYKAGNGR